MNRPASLASVSGAKPVQPEMPIATLVCACAAPPTNTAAASASSRARCACFMCFSCFDGWMDRFSAAHAGVHNAGKPARVRNTRDSAPSVTSSVARSNVGREVAVAVHRRAHRAKQRVCLLRARPSSSAAAGTRCPAPRPAARCRGCARCWRSSAAGGAPRTWPSTRGLPGWPRSAANRRWPDAPATCSRWPATPRSRGRS